MKKFVQQFLFVAACATMLNTSAKSQNLVEAVFQQSVSQATLNLLGSQFGLTADNGMDVYLIRYSTMGTDGVLDTASGLFLVPDHGQPSPLVAYQHGTVDGREDVPSRLNFPFNISGGSLVSIFFAANGYAVSATDYLGLGDSRGFHPYVHAETEAQAGLDMLYAVHEFADNNAIEFSDKLFVAGYSQGGHAAQALHRELEWNHSMTLPLTATAPMSGPYSVSGVMLEGVLSDTEYFTPGYLPYVLRGYQEVYGNVYDSLEQIFKPQFIPIIERFENPDYSLFDINDSLIARLQTDFGMVVPKHMFLDSIVDGLTNNPSYWLHVFFEDNDTYDWSPQIPTRMYYCEADDQVFYQNAIVARDTMVANGAADVESISVGANLDHGDCALPAVNAALDFFNSFLISSNEPEPLHASAITVFPNPASDAVFVENGYDREAIQFEILDVSGRAVLNGQVNSQDTESFNLRNLNKGMYVMRFTMAERVFSTKLIIQ